MDSEDLGRRVPVSTAALRPEARLEIAKWGGPRLGRGKRVLDVGCGDGRLALAFAADASSVVGVDPDSEAIRLARANARARGIHNASFRVAAAQDLPLARGAFDLVVLSWTL